MEKCESFSCLCFSHRISDLMLFDFLWQSQVFHRFSVYVCVCVWALAFIMCRQNRIVDRMVFAVYCFLILGCDEFYMEYCCCNYSYSKINWNVVWFQLVNMAAMMTVDERQMKIQIPKRMKRPLSILMKIFSKLLWRLWTFHLSGIFLSHFSRKQIFFCT